MMNDLQVIPKCEDHGLQMEYVIPQTYADISSCRIIARTTQEFVIIGAGIDEETHGAILLRKHVETLKCFCENCKKRVESDYKYCPFCGDIFSSVYVAKDANDQFEKLYGRKKSE